MTQPSEEADCSVLIVGGGPTGLFLACLLIRRGVDVRVLERRTTPSAHSRAIGLHPPALRALAEIGLEDDAVALGTRIRIGRARSRGRELGSVDFDRAGGRHPFVLSLPQSRTEALLAEQLAALAPAALLRGWEVTELQESAHAVTATAVTATAETATAVTATAVTGRGTLRVRAGLVVGADGSRSRVRSLLGIAAPGRDYPDTYLMGDLADPAGADAESEAIIHLEPDGVVESFPLPDGRRRWVVHTGSAGSTGGAGSTGSVARPGAGLTPARLTALIRERTGAVLDPSTATMLSPFSVRRRTARRLLSRRCVLVGDAAHEVSPIGGQGITLGWLDALDLAPLLARAATAGGARDLRDEVEWRRAERRIRRRARIAGLQAAANTALGRPCGAGMTTLRALAVRGALRTPLRRALAWAYSMGWAPGHGDGAQHPGP